EGTITGGNLVENGYLVLDHLPVSLPGTPEEPDFDWYQSRADVILEQGLLSVDELVSGLYYTSEDLNITSSNTYQGRFIIASTGIIRIQSDLIPRDPGEDSLIIIAREIEMDPGAGEIHGSFVGSETFQAKGSWEAKNIFGTVQSRQVILSSKSTRITYRPWFVPGLAPGNRTTLYHISHWQEITPL
ncbi:MAG TPA: hypothetical protein GX711_06555, partial [Clostridia bacterium]|nr:hypothetical protein [Clostridia bacterium]